MKIIAIVPTYNRPNLLLKNIYCLLNQNRALDKIIIVDNASEPETRQVLESMGYLSHPQLKYIRLDNNIGSSGGFRAAMMAAIDAGADWVWGMDDDAFPRYDALSRLMEANISDEYQCLWSNADDDCSFEEPIKLVDHFMFVGYFVSRKLIQIIGYPDEKFYMYHDDTEYSQRITSHGFPIVKVRDSVIDHKGYDKRGVAVTTYGLFGINFSVFNCEPFRIYYMYRNGIYTKLNSVDCMHYFFKTLTVTFPKYLLVRPRSGLAIALALFHMLSGRRGYINLPKNFYDSYDIN